MLAFTFACSGGGGISGDSPTEAYKRLFAAVKSKDTEAIRKQMTKKSIAAVEFSAKRYNKTLAQAFENGFTETTFSDTLPAIRDERIKDDMGAIEVWNSKSSRWEDLPFVIEDSVWKFAMGDLLANTFRSPGKGRDLIEKEAANAVATPVAPAPSNTNTNTVMVANAVPVVPKTEKKPK